MDGFHQATAAQKLIYDGKDEYLQRDLKKTMNILLSCLQPKNQAHITNIENLPHISSKRYHQILD